METEQAKFEGWAVIEMMGHQRETGFVTTEYYGGAALFRVDVPELPEREYELERPEYVDGRWCGTGSKVKRAGIPARSRLVSPSALYAMNPCTEEAARKALERIERSLILIDFKEDARRSLAEKYPESMEPEYEDDPEEEARA